MEREDLSANVTWGKDPKKMSGVPLILGERCPKPSEEHVLRR